MIMEGLEGNNMTSAEPEEGASSQASGRVAEQGQDMRSVSGNRKEPLKLSSPSATRWLVFSDCIDRLLPQYDALSTYFKLSGAKEKCYEGNTLGEMYKDKSHRLYMIFLNPALQELKRIGALFQSNLVNNTKFFAELKIYFIAHGRRILKPKIMSSNLAEALCDLNLDTEFALLPIEYADLGEYFRKKLACSPIQPEKKAEIRHCAAVFLKELFVGLQKRIKPLLLC